MVLVVLEFAKKAEKLLVGAFRGEADKVEGLLLMKSALVTIEHIYKI